MLISFLLLSREYAEAKSCARNATITLCLMTDSIKVYMEFLYDDFNPFCTDLTDPPTVQAPKKFIGKAPEKTSGATKRIVKFQLHALPWLVVLARLF